MPLLEDVLTQIGIEPSLIPDIVANKEGLQLDEITSKVKENFSSKLLDDVEFIGKISKDKLQGTDVFKQILVEGQSKATGILLKQYKEYHGIEDGDLTEEQRKDFIKHAAPIVKERLSKVKMDDVAKTLESENITLKSKIEELQSASSTLREKLESEFNERLSIKEQDSFAHAILSPMQENIKFGLFGSLKEAIENVRTKFAVVAGNGVVELKDKSNPSFTAKIDGKPATYKDALIAEIKAFGAWVEPTSQAATSTHITVPVNADKGVLHNLTGLSDAEMKRMLEENS